jgi:phospholipid/cholesterol/gamma-HCH transport system substrate-binding protein
MDERVMQFRVGVMFLATFLIVGILLAMFGKLPSMVGRTYDVQIRFQDAAGVTKDTPVRKNGILIGRVSDVRLIEKDAAVLVTAKIHAGFGIYKNEDCYITRNLLSGDSSLTFVADPGKQELAGKIMPLDQPLPGRYTYSADDPTGLKRELQRPINTVEETGQALTAASKQLGAAAKRVDDILDNKTQTNVQSVLRDAAASLETIREMLGDRENREKLSQAMKRMPDTLDNMNRTFQATEEALRKFTERAPDGKTAVERMVGTIEMTERTLRKFSEPSREGEPAPADQIAKAMENIGEITTLMRSIMDRIDRGEGSIGALMNDRQLYDRLNRAARNVEEVSYQLKPIVADARVFMDKAARHPGVILRDAVKPGVGIK